MAAGSRKRLFIGLISATSLALCVFLVLLWVIPYLGLRTIHPVAPWVLGAVITVMVALICWAAVGLVLNIVIGRPLPFTRKIRGLTIKLFLPLMTLLGRIAGLSKSRIRSSFIQVNNEMVQAEAGQYEPDKVLLLLPHCLQNSRCDMRLTYNIDNCKRCGLCPLAGLLHLRDHYGVHLAIATGGTIARRIVVQTRPRMILAVACERDLASGIQDTYPLQVFGVLNERPNGPCLDTQVALPRLEEALRRFIKPELLPEKTAAQSAEG